MAFVPQVIYSLGYYNGLKCSVLITLEVPQGGHTLLSYIQSHAPNCISSKIFIAQLRALTTAIHSRLAELGLRYRESRSCSGFIAHRDARWHNAISTRRICKAEEVDILTIDPRTYILQFVHRKHIP
jgi:hypothetical protein